MGTAPGSVVYLHYDADRGALVKGFEENGEPDIIEDEVRQERKLGPISVASCDWRERRKDWNAYRAMLKERDEWRAILDCPEVEVHEVRGDTLYADFSEFCESYGRGTSYEVDLLTLEARRSTTVP